MARNCRLISLGLALCLVIPLSGCGNGVVDPESESEPKDLSTIRPGLGADKPAPDRPPTSCRFCNAARELGVRVVPLTPRSIQRCPPNHMLEVCPLHPSGASRVDDLVDYAMQVDVGYEAGGHLEFRVNDKVVASQRFDPVRVVTRAKLPKSVIERLLQERGKLTWGYVPPKGEPRLKDVRIVSLSSNQETRLDAIEQQWGADKAVMHLLRGLYLYELRLYDAARREAFAVLELQPDEPHALALLSDALLGLNRRMETMSL